MPSHFLFGGSLKLSKLIIITEDGMDPLLSHFTGLFDSFVYSFKGYCIQYS